MSFSDEEFKYHLDHVRAGLDRPERYQTVQHVLKSDIIWTVRKPDIFDTFLERTYPMNETDPNTAQAQAQAPSNPAHYAREVLVRELMTWRRALDNTTRRVNDYQDEWDACRKLQTDAQHRVSSLETALRTV